MFVFDIIFTDLVNLLFGRVFMSGQVVSVAFRSLPKAIREAINSNISRVKLIDLLSKCSYSLGTRRSALFYFDRKNLDNVG